MCRLAQEINLMIVLAIPETIKHSLKEPWSEIEDEYLIKLYRIGGVDAVQKAIPSRTRRSIINRANRLGISQYGWLDSEDRILEQHYETSGPRYCQCYLPNRSINAIIKRANKLKRERIERAEKMFFCGKLVM